MEEPVLKIPMKKYADESTVISMRLPKEMLKETDAAAKASRRTRNELLMLCLEFALDHMQIIEDKKENIEGENFNGISCSRTEDRWQDGSCGKECLRAM